MTWTWRRDDTRTCPKRDGGTGGRVLDVAPRVPTGSGSTRTSDPAAAAACVSAPVLQVLPLLWAAREGRLGGALGRSAVRREE